MFTTRRTLSIKIYTSLGVTFDRSATSFMMSRIVDDSANTLQKSFALVLKLIVAKIIFARSVLHPTSGANVTKMAGGCPNP